MSKSKKVRILPPSSSHPHNSESQLFYPLLPEVLEQLLSADKSATEFRNAALEHHLDRAKICSKLIKYPNVKDYAVRLLVLSSPLFSYVWTKKCTAQRALEEHDKRQIYSTRERLREIQNIYAILADVIQKNISKVSSIDRSDPCIS